MDKMMRTPGGSPTAEAYRRYSVLHNPDRFPIWDKRSAIDAINLRHHNTTPQEVSKILNAAEHFAPAEAKAAREEDKK